jgi:hypothetical protein
MALEKEYGLVQAKGRALSNLMGIKPADLEKAVYGKTPTKRAITNIVNAVIRDYRFASLAEFNAIVRQFNVVADPGRENTLMRKKGGMLYSLINGKGEQVGIPIKASAIYNKPTLAALQKEFELNKEKKQQYREPLKRSIEQAFSRYSHLTRKKFIEELQRRKVNVVFRVNDQGFTYGVTFIDNWNKAVFNGSDLGKGYSAKAILARLDTTDFEAKKQQSLNQKLNDKQMPATIEQVNHLSLSAAKNQPEAAPTVTRKKKTRRGQRKDQGLIL